MGQWIVYIACILVFFQTNNAYAQSILPEDQASAVIFSYSRVGDDTYPRANVSTDNFQAHIQELLSGNYTVLPVPDIIEAFTTDADLPPGTIGITFDAGYKSVLDNAVPLLIKANLPFTIFVAAQDIGPHPGLIDWSELKRLKKKYPELVSFGLHPSLNTHMAQMDKKDILYRLNAGRLALQDHLKTHVTLLAYPYGVYDTALYDAASNNGFTAAFGQHSGAAHKASDLYALPRFNMSDKYSDLERFTLVAKALPLPAKDIEPFYSYVGDAGISGIGFTLPESLQDKASSLSCFISGQSQPYINILGKTRVELRPQSPVTDHRTRINCTIPEIDEATGDKYWRWLGMLLVKD